MPDANTVFQHSWYISNQFNMLMYGIELVLYSASVWLILTNKGKDRQNNMFFFWFSTALLVCITIQVAVQGVFGEMMWITHADYPGGSAAYFEDNSAVWYETLGSAASILLTLLSDWLLIYRCYIVWDSNWLVIAFPALLNVASGVMGILVCVYSGSPGSDFFAGLAVKTELAFRGIVLGLNVIVTALICGRILYVAKGMRAALGHDAARTYTSAAAIVIESALPYTLFGIAYMVTLGVNSPTSIFFLCFYVLLTCIAPQMIILRVLMGRGWTKDTFTGMSSMSFVTRTAPDPEQVMSESDRSGTLAATLQDPSKSNISSDFVSSKV
ncbi:hypothetical protein PHLGIDRAFT_86270 [Phlebiopsis gigantea 11061_1 CR5-6]|uniref:Uncharacterized protein n=1 Tax=Phlebiopsis gigantea (strain 11061_1 CR5-6) TaxID=745531 RepID=A0A0C3SDH3_PHLG1|nr:hypothetical protein PHLGIDRAFT_86270 [Phlebiopsis gigantea 11061_1 CR5-6]